jgi:hypothetical protein
MQMSVEQNGLINRHRRADAVRFKTITAMMPASGEGCHEPLRGASSRHNRKANDKRGAGMIHTGQKAANTTFISRPT